MPKLTCHCGCVEAEINVSINELPKIVRCNCSICKRKGYVMSPIGENDMKITKGEDKLTLYQFYTNTAKHYFCSVCGIFTHTRPRSNPKLHMINIACVEGVDPFEYKDVSINDGNNHPLDQ